MRAESNMSLVGRNWFQNTPWVYKYVYTSKNVSTENYRTNQPISQNIWKTKMGRDRIYLQRETQRR